MPALVAAAADGATSLSLRYRDHRIAAGKPALDGLPSTYVEDPSEAETLEITLVDEPSGLEVDLRFTIFAGRPVIARSAVIRNAWSAPADLRCAMSLSARSPGCRLADGRPVRRLGARAPRHRPARWFPAGNPCRASAARRATSTTRSWRCAATTTDEAHGEAYGFSLVYSGNFLAEAEVEPYGTARVRLGIEPSTFALATRAGGDVHDARGDRRLLRASGLGGVSDAFHDLFRDRLARGHWRDRPRPVLINNWEATYFGFDADRLVEIATTARDLGVELFVLDDGWFGARDDDTTSLGDWFVDRRKLPDGLDGVARRITELGIGFGLWIEPEMVSERSRLFEDAPGLGDRHPRPAAHREPPAARPRHGPARGRRPPDRRS